MNEFVEKSLASELKIAFFIRFLVDDVDQQTNSLV